MDQMDYQSFSQRYTKQNVIGRGQYGTVHRVRDCTDGKAYALKSSVLPCSTSQQSKRLLIEISNLKKIAHKNAIKIIHYYCINRTQMSLLKTVEVGLVMEMGKFSLENLIQELRRREKDFKYKEFQFDLLKFAFEFIDMLAQMQTLKIAHRDIKPANIVVMCQRPLECKLIDFGLSRDFALMSEEDEYEQFVGTYHYASPEMKRIFDDTYRNGRVVRNRVIKGDHQMNYYKNDVYSLGLTILQLSMLKVPQNPLSTNEVYLRFVELYGCESHLVRLVSLMLEKNKDIRVDFIDLNKQALLFKSWPRSSSSLEKYQKTQTEPSIQHQSNRSPFSKKMFVQQQLNTKVVSKVEANYPNCNFDDLSFAATLKPTHSIITRGNKQPLVQLATGLKERPRTKVAYRQTDRFECPSAVMCIRTFDQLVLYGLENGSVGAIYKGNQYLLEPSNIQKNLPQLVGKHGVSCIQSIGNDIWTSTLNSRIIIWSKAAIINQIEGCNDQPVKKNLFAKSKPAGRARVINSDRLCKELKGFPVFKYGISSLCLIQDSDRYAIGYNSGNVYIKNKDQTFLRTVHSAPVSCIRHRNNQLFTTGHDGMVKKLNLIANEVYYKFYCTEGTTIINCQVFDGQIGVITLQNNVSILNEDLDKIISQKMGNQCIFGSCFFKERCMLLTASGAIVESQRKLFQLVDSEGPSCISFNDNLIVVGSFEGRVHVIEAY